MAQCEIISECEGPREWIFDARVLGDDGTLRRHTITVAWADYNLWSRSGNDPPSAIALAVLGFYLSRVPTPDDVPKSFDAAIARRLFKDADEEIPRWVGGG